jgi:hypothetical protein
VKAQKSWTKPASTDKANGMSDVNTPRACTFSALSRFGAHLCHRAQGIVPALHA